MYTYNYKGKDTKEHEGGGKNQKNSNKGSSMAVNNDHANLRYGMPCGSVDANSAGSRGE